MFKQGTYFLGHTVYYKVRNCIPKIIVQITWVQGPFCLAYKSIFTTPNFAQFVQFIFGKCLMHLSWHHPTCKCSQCQGINSLLYSDDRSCSKCRTFADKHMTKCRSIYQVMFWEYKLYDMIYLGVLNHRNFVKIDKNSKTF